MKKILLYGYNEKDAGIIKSALKDFFILSASRMEDEKIEEIVKKESKEFFEAEDKVLMFIGFENDEELYDTLKKFPKSVDRPFFCAETKHNMSWKFSALLAELKEEAKAFQQSGQE